MCAAEVKMSAMASELIDENSAPMQPIVRRQTGQTHSWSP